MENILKGIVIIFSSAVAGIFAVLGSFLSGWMLYVAWSRLVVPIFALHGVVLPTIAYYQCVAASLLIAVIRIFLVKAKYVENTDKQREEAMVSLGGFIALTFACYIINWIWL